ncbi:MAG: OmpA family protein [Bacteroidales bacterium]
MEGKKTLTAATLPVSSKKIVRKTQSYKNVTFDPIYFQSNLPYVEKKSFYNVAKLIKFLKANPEVVIHLDAFSDAKGSPEVKAKISARRAKVLKQYLKENGIASKRITTEARGDEQLVNKCTEGVDCTAAEHAQNRRIEISFGEE